MKKNIYDISVTIVLVISGLFIAFILHKLIGIILIIGGVLYNYKENMILIVKVGAIIKKVKSILIGKKEEPKDDKKTITIHKGDYVEGDKAERDVIKNNIIKK